VEGHIPAAVDPVQRHAARSQLGFVEQHVLSMTRAAKGVGRRVLQQQQRVGDLVRCPLRCQVLLQFPRLGVGHGAQAPHFTDCHGASKSPKEMYRDFVFRMIRRKGRKERKEKQKAFLCVLCALCV
jgi:hypothetical protein